MSNLTNIAAVGGPCIYAKSFGGLHSKMSRLTSIAAVGRPCVLRHAFPFRDLQYQVS